MRPESSPGGLKNGSFVEQARRAQIIAAATATVAQVGYIKASLARIAREAGISKSVISYHFAGKEELLEHVVSQFFEQAGEYMEGRLATTTTARERIGVWVESQMAFFGANRTGFLAMSEVVAYHRAPDGTRPYAGIEEEEIAELSHILEGGQRAGEFRDFDTRAVAGIITQSTEGVLGRWAYDASTDLHAQTAALVDFIDHAIRKETS